MRRIILLLLLPTLFLVYPDLVSATKYISNNSTGGDCSSIGSWDSETKTCTLNMDLNEPVVVNDHTTLDGNGHSITGSRNQNGVTMGNYSTLKNSTIKGFSWGIYPHSNNIIENNILFGNNYNISLVNGANNNVIKGNKLPCNFYGIYSHGSHGTLIENNHFESEIGAACINLYYSDNIVIRNNDFHQGWNTIRFNFVSGSKIYSNNFFSGTKQPVEIIGSYGNVFDDGSENGGNYWESYDEPSEGCEDTDNDGFCDSPFSVVGLYNGYNAYDNFAFVKPTDFIEPQQPKLNPVIVIPGIMGSAYKNGELVIDPILHTYDDLIATLSANGYEKEKTLFTFPYEWRDSNVKSADLLRSKINQVIQVCEESNLENVECSKVDLIAHSMGGLVAREYIQSLDYLFDVDQLIFLGTPHKGAPKAYLQWEAGENDVGLKNGIMETYFLAEAARNGYQGIYDYIHDRPIESVRQLLPIFDYLRDKDTGNIREYPYDYPRNSFLVSLNNSLSYLSNKGVNVTNFVGDSGQNKTIQYIRVEPVDNTEYWEHGKPDGFGAIFGDNGLERGVGDNTVTKYSATLDGFQNEELTASHDRIPTVAENKIIKILTGRDSVTDIDNGSYLSGTVLFLQLLSPIDVVVTDSEGRRIGKNFETGEEYSEIPGAFYSGHNNGDDEYVTIPNPSGQYKIEVQGTEEGGKYGVLTSYISDTFAVTAEAAGITKPGQLTELNTNIDYQEPSNLEVERVITPEVFLSDINGAYDLGWIKELGTRNFMVAQVNNLIKFDKKIDIIKEKRTERFEIKVDKILAKLLIDKLHDFLNAKKITQEAFDLLKSDIEYLINN